MDRIEAAIYSVICSHEGIKAREIGKYVNQPRKVINQYLYGSPYMQELCYQDEKYRWYGLISQGIMHRGIEEFSGYYSMVSEFLDTDFDEFFERLKGGCRQIGRNLNDTRGLFHSFEDTYDVMQNLFADLYQEGISRDSWKDWEILFELRIKRARHIRIYADVILMTGLKIFSLEFKMKDRKEPDDLVQAAKYCEYLEVLFGEHCDVIPVLVLTTGEDIYEYEEVKKGCIPVCSGDRLHQLVKEYCFEG